MDLSSVNQVVGIIALGTGAQLLAWRIGVPSIVFLLFIGVICGPVLGFIKPDQLFGELLSPLVSLSVAFILFEGGASLHLKDLPRVGKVVVSLISVGVFVAFACIAMAARMILQVGWPVALLLGAILVVSGPTVVIPLLRNLRPRPPLGAILRWEGILIDPVGVVLAALVAEVIIERAFSGAPLTVVWGILLSLLVGVGVGIVGAAILVSVLRKYLLPDHFHLPFTVMIVLLSYSIANSIYIDSGLVTVTVLGLIVADRGGRSSELIIEFGANLQPLLVALLFITLSARMQPDDLKYLDYRMLMFLVVLVLVIRPVTVFVSTFGSKLRFRERLLLSGVAPRGIVAASLASVLALNLEQAGFADIDAVVPYTFFTIIGTVLVYGTISVPFCALLNLRDKPPQGVLFVGAGAFARAFALVLKDLGVKSVLVDTNERSVRRARRQGLRAYLGNALAENIGEVIAVESIGSVVALSSSDKVNTLTSVEFAALVGRGNVYQLATGQESEGVSPVKPRGELLFSRPLGFADVEEMWEKGIRPAAARGSAVAKEALLLAVVKPQGKVLICSSKEKIVVQPDDSVVVFDDPLVVNEHTSVEPTEKTQ